MRGVGVYAALLLGSDAGLVKTANVNETSLHPSLHSFWFNVSGDGAGPRAEAQNFRGSRVAEAEACNGQAGWDRVPEPGQGGAA